MKTTIKKRPEAIYDVFERKIGSDKKNTHYCPGCGHGRIQKLIAEAIDDLGLGDQTVFISPVGCAVFSYYYMNTGNVQAAHGRAPAVATGVARARPDSIVINYQGDGDLAAIGMAEIIHAANRGENITTIFVNNAIYGMTGGQMAPTTLVGQKTPTSPLGRSFDNDGMPIRMAEIIAGLEAPVYVERTTCTDHKNIMKTRKAIRKALRLQKEKKGYSFIEILTACPTNWKKSPKESIEWIQDELEPYFKPGVYKDISDKVKPFTKAEECKDVDTILESLELTKGAPQTTVPQGFGEKRIKFAGFGGQGVLTGGLLLAKTGMEIGLNVSWIPSYGPEMRGGTANCSVIISDKRIASPLVNTPDILVAMNGPSLDTFEKDVKAGGLILVNTSLVDRKVEREDVEVVYAPLTDIAVDLGFKGAANSVALGALLNKTDIFPIEKVFETLPGFFKKPKAVDLNINALKAGSECI